MVANACHTVRDEDPIQHCAFVKSKFPDAFYTIRNDDPRQSSALIKSPIFNTRNYVWKRNCCQAGTAAECIFPDFAYALRNNSLGQRTAILKRMGPNGF